jgi:hypothetical protein
MDERCIICLVAGNTIQFKGSCKCSPHIHVACVDGWFKTNKSCPICRVAYVTPSASPAPAALALSPAAPQQEEEPNLNGVYTCLCSVTCIAVVLTFLFI